MNATKLVIEINIGNAEMSSGQNMAYVLKKVASQVACCNGIKDAPVKILDVNGNTVGYWEFK